MKMSVIIVAYKSGDVLLKCLDSIEMYNDLGSDLEVIIVDNSPEEERVDKVISATKLHDYTYIPANNDGFGAGNNIGARIAQGEVLAFINPDIILIEPVFRGVYEDFQNNDKLALEGVRLLYEDRMPGFSFYYDFNTKLWRNWTIKFWNKVGHFDSKRMFISGANLFVRKEVFCEVGMFDENMFMYYEEPELIRRIKNFNNEYLIAFNPTFNMIHLEKKSTPTSVNMIGHAWESAIYYGKKHGLNYKDKINFEYRYYYFKMLVLGLVNKEKAMKQKELVVYLKKEFGEHLN